MKTRILYRPSAMDGRDLFWIQYFDWRNLLIGAWTGIIYDGGYIRQSWPCLYCGCKFETHEDAENAMKEFLSNVNNH